MGHGADLNRDLKRDLERFLEDDDGHDQDEVIKRHMAELNRTRTQLRELKARRASVVANALEVIKKVKGICHEAEVDLMQA